MNQAKKNILFISACLILTCGAIAIKCYSEYMKKNYGELYMEFIDIADSYEVGSELEAISFIKETNAENVEYPNIDTSSPGKRNFFYIITDKVGNTREFALTLNITDPILPIIELNNNEVQVEEGSVIDLTSFINRAYDPVDGELPYVIKKPDNYESIGTHKISYSCKDKNENYTEETLILVVKEKPKETVEKPTPNTTNQKQESIPNPQPEPQPSSPRPQNKNYMFADGYNMQTAPQVCNEDLLKAQNANYGATCIQVNGDDGWPIGMQLIIK